MPLPWVRLDTQFPTNPKVLFLAEQGKFRALFVYCCSLSYSGAHGTDGYIPRTALPYIHARAREAGELVDAKLWVADRKGWYMPDWSDYQQTSDQATEAVVAQRVKSRKGNCVRWHGPDCGCWKEPP